MLLFLRKIDVDTRGRGMGTQIQRMDPTGSDQVSSDPVSMRDDDDDDDDDRLFL